MLFSCLRNASRYHILPSMKMTLDIEDHARLPWRFYAARQGVMVRLSQ